MLDLTHPVLIYWNHIFHVFHSITETDQISISSPLLVCLSTISRALSLVLSIVNKSLSFCCLFLYSTKMRGWILPNVEQLELRRNKRHIWILNLKSHAICILMLWTEETIVVSNLKFKSKVTGTDGWNYKSEIVDWPASNLSSSLIHTRVSSTGDLIFNNIQRFAEQLLHHGYQNFF